MDKMMKHKKAADKRRKEIKAETKNNGGSLIEGNEDEDVHVIDENDSKSPNQQKSAYLKRQIQRLERLVKSDGISEEKLRELSTRLGVVRSFQRESKSNNGGG